MLKKIINKLFNYNKNLIDNINRHSNDDLPIMQWCNRGTIYNKKDQRFGKWFFYVFTISLTLLCLFVLIIPTFIYLNNTIIFKSGLTIGLIFFYAPIIILMYFGMNQIKYYDYKITFKEIELASWQEGIIFAVYVSKIFLWFLVIGCLIAFMVEPSLFLVGFGGLAAVGAIAGVKVLSKGYIDTHLDYQNIRTTWDKVSKIEINESLHLVYIWGDDLNHPEHIRDL